MQYRADYVYILSIENIKDIIDDWKIYKEHIKKNNSPDYIIYTVDKYELVIKIIKILLRNEKIIKIYSGIDQSVK
jgi:hypothetical protein